jgi:hypothetical protein
MMQQETESMLVEAMKRLETAADNVVKTSGYTNDAKKYRLLIELIKEQIRNENTLSAARPLR